MSLELTEKDIDELQNSDLITVNELEPVLFDNYHELLKSDLSSKEKLLYLNRLFLFNDLNDNLLSELYGIFRIIDEGAAVVKNEFGKIIFSVDGIEGVINRKEGITFV